MSIPQVNPEAPDFELPDADGLLRSLRDFRGKNVVLAFYPADWSPVCSGELTLLAETLQEIHEYNAEVVGISVDQSFCHRAWSDQQHYTFPLLSDFWPHGQVSRQYGVFRESDGLSQRAMFFIDSEGLIHSAWVSEDQDVAPGLDIVFNALERMEDERKEKLAEEAAARDHAAGAHSAASGSNSGGEMGEERHV